MALAADKLEFNICDFNKCGEVTTLLSIGKKEFFLNCGFCKFSFLNLNNFIQHVYEEHLSEFQNLELKQEVTNIPLTIQGDPSDDETMTHSEDADKEAEYSENVVKGFERVEIEFDSDDEDISLDTNRYSQNLIEKEVFYINNEDSAAKNAAETDSVPEYSEGVKQRHGRRMDIEEYQTTNYEEPDDIDIKLEEVEIGNDTEMVATDKTQGKLKLQQKTFRKMDSLLDAVQSIILAEIYKEHTCLWNEQDIAYRFRNRRQEALEDVYKEFNTKTGLNLTQDDLEKEIIRLRKICSNEKKQKIHCKRNKLVYDNICTYYDHIAFLEDDVPPFECSICGKLHPGLGQLKVHLASHDGSLPFICHICGHGFQLGTNLTVHLRRHAKDYTYNCEVCNKPCATTTEIKIHMRSHTGEKPFICYICGRNFKTSSQLLTHTMRHEKRPRHKCEICSRNFYEAGTLTEHMKVHSKVRDNICDVCNKGFKSRKQLRQHQLIHDVEKKYICQFCGKRFAQSAGLCGHMKSHGEKFSTQSNTEIS